MKRLSVLLVFALLLLSACSKESVKAEYIVVASGDDYTDSSYILYKNFNNSESNFNSLSFSNGEATILGNKKCKFQFIFKPYSSSSFPYPPKTQTEGDVLNISIYKKKNNGTKGAKVGEIDITCTIFAEFNTVEVEW